MQAGAFWRIQDSSSHTSPRIYVIPLGQLVPRGPAGHHGNNTAVLSSTNATQVQQTELNELSSSTSNYCCQLPPAPKMAWSSPEEAGIKPVHVKGKIGTI